MSLLKVLAVSYIATTGNHLAFGQCVWDPVMKHLAAQSDDRSHRAAANLSHICTTVRASDIQASEAAKKCLGPSTRLFTEADKTILAKAFGTISSSTLKVLLPTVATLLSKPVVGMIGAFLVPEDIAKDPIDTISNPDREPKDDLVKAARSLLWNTDPQAFRVQLSPVRKASITGCLLAQ